MKFLGDINPKITQNVVTQSVSITKDWELGLLGMADIIVTVSAQETRTVNDLNECSKVRGSRTGAEICKFTRSVYSVGHVMDSTSPTEATFDDRHGILFVGAFHEKMYYNGDAVWYFVTEIFPLIVKETGGTIPLTIAGRKIPTVLRESIQQNSDISEHVRFVESPTDLMLLYNQTRLVIAPHLYGAGIQFKVRISSSVGSWRKGICRCFHRFASSCS